MRRGGNAILFTAALASAGCVTDTGKLEVRPLADPYAKATKAGSPAVAEGRSLLAMGSVGLAIEAFLKALIQYPDSIEVLAGLAECYDQMGRPDLARAKYEAALAIAPNNATLLRTFAVSLERQGNYAEGASLRREAAESERADVAVLASMAPAAPMPFAAQPAAVTAAPAVAKPKSPSPAVAVVQPKPVESSAMAPVPIKVAEVRAPLASAPIVTGTKWTIEAPTVVPVEMPPAASVTVKLPPAAPPLRLEAPKAALAAPKPVQLVKAPEPVSAPRIASAAMQRPVGVEADPLPSGADADIAELAAASSITVKLPAPRPAVVTEKTPAAPAIKAILSGPPPLKTGPRLERMSLGEVALLTDPRPRWQAEAARWTAITRPLRPAPAKAPPAQMAINSSVRFVPLAELQRSYGVRLLNAARHDGLAASTRTAFNRQGWKSVTIGDAQRVRQKSLILYSERTEPAARRLAAQYGIWIAKEARPGPLTILLGRDWVSRRQARA